MYYLIIFLLVCHIYVGLSYFCWSVIFLLVCHLVQSESIQINFDIDQSCAMMHGGDYNVVIVNYGYKWSQLLYFYWIKKISIYYISNDLTFLFLIIVLYSQTYRFTNVGALKQKRGRKTLKMGNVGKHVTIVICCSYYVQIFIHTTMSIAMCYFTIIPFRDGSHTYVWMKNLLITSLYV